MVSFLKIKIPFWIVAISILPQWVFGSGPVDRRIQTAVDSWVGTGKVAGVVVGLLSPEGQKIFSSGVVSKGSGAKPGPDTIFEVGSITKVFTTLLFMDEVGKGRMALNDPVSIYMPPGLSLPKRARSWRNFWKLPSLEEPVRLRHLALHTSGFPRTPSILDIPKDWSVSDPDYITTAMVEDFFNRFTFKRDPGVAYEYSVINTGLLGIAVCTREQKDYESLLIGRILEPMGLKDTRMELSREQSKRLAQGYGVKGQPVASIHMARETAGSGNLKSTARDLLKFISFSLGFQPCPLESELKEALVPCFEINTLRKRSLGYEYLNTPYGSMAYQDGKTLGFQSFLAIFPMKRIGVVVLENSTQINSQAMAGIIVDIVMRDRENRNSLSSP